MTIGIPFDMSFQSSNVTDPVPELEELLDLCQSPVFDEGLEIKSGQWIYSYTGKSFTPREWSQSDETSGEYQIGDVLFKDCGLVKVTGKDGSGVVKHRQPKQPENYSCHDTDMHYKDWKCRYVKVSNSTSGKWLSKVWNDQNKQYTMVWSASENKYKWVTRDTRGSGGSAYYGIYWTGSYKSWNDRKAIILNWGGPGLSRTPTMRITSMVSRRGYFFLRTNINAPLEYDTWTSGTGYKYTYNTIETPADIPGFVEKRQVQAVNPFDGKNYTRTEFDTSVTEGFASWDMVASEDIDSIAFGLVNCDTIDIRVSDQNGESLWQLNGYPIDNTVAPGRYESHPSTVILYMDRTYPAGSIVTVKLHGAVVVIGEMIGASKLDAGFTNVEFSNTFKDFSPKEQDQWGNWFYIDGVRVKIHTGTCEFPIVSYDQLNRLMLMIGGQKVVINSSDSTANEVPDGRHVFESSMMIARFTKFDLQSSTQNKRIGEKGSYTFSIEELV